MSKYYIGFDIGGTKCAVVLGKVDKGQISIVGKERIETDLSVKPEIMLGKMCDIAQKYMQEFKVESLGISCGSPLNSKTGHILSPPNLIGWDNVPATDFCYKRLGIMAKLQNDANACAYAEYKFGAGKGSKNMIFCTMGTGFGAGFIFNGKLYVGSCDNAGEIGHVRLSDMGPVGYGKRGTVEGYCSGGGIAQLGKIFALEELQCGKYPLFCKTYADINSITAKSIAIAADKGDETAIKVYKQCGKYLGKTLALLIDVINPDTIVIGSIYARSHHLIEESMWEEIHRESLALSTSICRILPAKLGESLGDIAAISVAML